jgi:hypothetical protein
MKFAKETGLAAVVLLTWVALGSLCWRIVFRPTVMSLESQATRSGAGIVTLIASQAMAYVVVRFVYRLLGRRGSFLRWSLDELERFVNRKN